MVCKNIDCVEPQPCKGDLGPFREARPAHYVCRVNPFSSYSKLERFSLPIFVQEGYRWQLVIYPNGNKYENGGGHLSIYLCMADATTSLPPDWEIKAVFRLFVFNQTRGIYLMAKGTHEKRFDAVKNTWGVSQVIPLKTLKKPTKGYLLDDTCVVGAEVFPIKSTVKLESLSVAMGGVGNPPVVNHSWKIKNLSELKHKKELYSEEFKAGDYKWKIEFHVASRVSLNLILSDSTSFPSRDQVFVEVGLCIRNQANDVEDYVIGKTWFTAAHRTWGCHKYMSFAKLKDEKCGFAVEDACLVNAKVSVLGVVKE